MRFVATHPDVAEVLTIDTKDPESAVSIAAEHFAETLDLPAAAALRGVHVSLCDVAS
ncbi:hypothetical protein [Mycolicibacterium sp.]|uniref:hypothetical protein n=1 Tax=Mycolicibacterium sp. TaxID=2320850 RepID=UPI00355E97D2